MDLSYVLPIRCDGGPHEHAELATYLETLAGVAEVLVVDGSPAEVLQEHGRVLPSSVRHVPPDPALRFRNGKVNGVTTGVLAAGSERVVLADDDVRYDLETLATVAGLLDAADLVVPQNVFASRPWHARWDEARSLVNRAVGMDYPGTLAVRRSRFTAMGGYDGDVLFENLELMRTVAADGGLVLLAPDVAVPRLPPDLRTFLNQRVRQAYDDFAQPPRLLAFLAIAPLVMRAMARRRAGVAVAMALGAVAAAEAGRRREGGRETFPATSALWAPLWLLERAVCSWLAVGARLRGGARYRGSRLFTAATPMRALRRRAAQRSVERPPAAWVPSQSGLERERPHRQSATTRLRTSTSQPDSSTTRSGPRTR